MKHYANSMGQIQNALDKSNQGDKIIVLNTNGLSGYLFFPNTPFGYTIVVNSNPNNKEKKDATLAK